MEGDLNKDWPLEPFSTASDAHTQKHAWEEWRETFELVLESKRVEAQREKFVLLMTRGGKDIRDIHKNQAPCDEEVTELLPPRLVIPVYDNAIARLDKYFGGKISTRMELERFRGLKQEAEEDFAKFLLRLRAQAKRCDFGTRTDEEVFHQATRGAADEKVRDKRIETSMTLDQLSQYAIGREILNEQKKSHQSSYTTSAEAPVMSIGGGKLRPAKRTELKKESGTGWKKRTGYDHGKAECMNCGSWSHKSGADGCRAAKLKCFNCGKTGHLAVKCRGGKQQGGTKFSVSQIEEDWADETPKPYVQVTDK